MYIAHEGARTNVLYSGNISTEITKLCDCEYNDCMENSDLHCEGDKSTKSFSCMNALIYLMGYSLMERK